MELDRQKQILSLVIDVLTTKFPVNTICTALYHLYSHKNLITEDEFIFMKTLILKNKPSKDNKYKKFTENRFWYDDCPIDGFWWVTTANQIRISFIKELIKNLK